MYPMHEFITSLKNKNVEHMVALDYYLFIERDFMDQCRCNHK